MARFSQALPAALLVTLSVTPCLAQVPFSSTSESLSPGLVGVKASFEYQNAWIAVDSAGEIWRSQNGADFMSSGNVVPVGVIDFGTHLLSGEDLYVLRSVGASWVVQYVPGFDTPTGGFLSGGPTSPPGPVGEFGRRLVTANLDGIGSWAEAVVASQNFSGETTITGLSLDPTLGSSFTEFDITFSGIPVDLEVTDINGDGNDEIWVLSATGEVRRLSAPAGAWILEEIINVPVSGIARGIAVGELSGGGLPEIVVVETGGMTGTPLHIVSNPTGTAWSSFSSVEAGTVTGGGKPVIFDVDYDNDADICFDALVSGLPVISTFFQNVNDPSGPFNTSGMQIDGTPTTTLTLAAQVRPTGEVEFISASVAGNVLRRVNSTEKFVRGDVNDDGDVDISDVVELLDSLFTPGSTSFGDVADTNDDGMVDVSDSIYLSAFLFVPSSPPPPAPFNEEGFDLTEDRNSLSPNYDIGE